MSHMDFVREALDFDRKEREEREAWQVAAQKARAERTITPPGPPGRPRYLLGATIEQVTCPDHGPTLADHIADEKGTGVRVFWCFNGEHDFLEPLRPLPKVQTTNIDELEATAREAEALEEDLPEETGG